MGQGARVVGRDFLDGINVSIKRRTPPPAALVALRAGLRRVAGGTLTTALAAERSRLAVRSVISTRGAVRVYHADVQRLLASVSVSVAARPAGWRFFVPGLSNDQAADVIGDRKGYEMVRWIEGPDNRRFLDAVERPATRAALGNGKFELRCLEVPVLHLLAVWLYRPRGDQIFVPVSHLPVSIVSLKPLRLEEFDRSIQEHVRSVAERAKLA